MRDNEVTLPVYAVQAGDLENGMAASGGDKVGQRCVGWDGKGTSENEPA